MKFWPKMGTRSARGSGSPAGRDRTSFPPDPRRPKRGLKGKVPLLSLHALEQIHIFIFILAITHVVLSAVTVLLGLLQIRKWMHWENTIQEEGDSAPQMITRVQKIKFIQEWCKGYNKVTMAIIWMHVYGSLNKDDYVAMRLGFVMEHFGSHPEFNFYDYMVKALEKDFKRVVGIKWYHWIFVMVFLLLNVTALLLLDLTDPVGSLLLVIGTKLEHVINRMAYEVASKHAAAGEEDEAAPANVVVSPSDEHFWFRRPRLVLVALHFILFQNAFEFAYFVWTLAMFGLSSCMMDGLDYSIARIVICVTVEVLCSYSTLPLYAIVTHMGSSFRSAVFADDVAEHIRGWADGERRRNRRAAAGDVGVVVGGAAADEPAGGEGEEAGRGAPALETSRGLTELA
ncbi:hypothetical protein ACP4OV_031876 [Aristida adscensionis]